jgi:hypothetical protein
MSFKRRDDDTMEAYAYSSQNLGALALFQALMGSHKSGDDDDDEQMFLAIHTAGDDSVCGL